MLFSILFTAAPLDHNPVYPVSSVERVRICVVCARFSGPFPQVPNPHPQLHVGAPLAHRGPNRPLLVRGRCTCQFCICRRSIYLRAIFGCPWPVVSSRALHLRPAAASPLEHELGLLVRRCTVGPGLVRSPHPRKPHDVSRCHRCRLDMCSHSIPIRCHRIRALHSTLHSCQQSVLGGRDCGR